LKRRGVTVFVVGWVAVLRREIELAVELDAELTSVHYSLGGPARRAATVPRQSRWRPVSSLSSLAESSGGQFWLPPSHAEVVATAPRLAEEIGAQYSLAFITERRPSLEDRRRLEVLPARPGLSLRSRRSHIVDVPVRAGEGRPEIEAMSR
jgi:hypothetical protein